MEVLAVILILSIVSTILFSILSSSKETNKKQLENNEQLSELSYVLKLITKDMRKTITYDPNNSTFKNRDGSIQYTYIFDAEKNTITRNNEVIATHIHSFSLTSIGDSISINIESINEHTISTQLSFRSGDGAKDEKNLLNDEGFSFLLVFLTIVLVTILGLGLLAVSSNSLKLSKHEREDQSIYYIAEAGVNYEKAILLEKANEAYQSAKAEYDRLPIQQKKYEKFVELYEENIKSIIEPLLNNENIINNFEEQLGMQPIARITLKQDLDTNLRYWITSIGTYGESPSQKENYSKV